MKEGKLCRRTFFLLHTNRFLHILTFWQTHRERKTVRPNTEINKQSTRVVSIEAMVLKALMPKFKDKPTASKRHENSDPQAAFFRMHVSDLSQKLRAKIKLNKSVKVHISACSRLERTSKHWSQKKKQSLPLSKCFSPFAIGGTLGILKLEAVWGTLFWWSRVVCR